MRTKIFILINIYFSVSLSAQNVVIDSVSNKPVESVHISFNNKGLVTNEDGYFETPEHEKIDSLYLSHISFKSKKIAFADLKKGDTIFLEESPIFLDEVVLNNFTAKDTIKKAIENIDKNYLKEPHNSFGFFRQSFQEDGIGVEMVEVDFIGYTKLENSKYTTKIINARRTENYSKVPFSAVDGVLSVIEKGDFVKHRVYFLDLSEMNNYAYSYKGHIFQNGVKIFKIAFKPRDKDDLKFVRNGELYIDSRSLAVVEINYGIDKSKMNKLTKNALKHNTNKNKPFFILKDLKNVIRYQLLSNEKWALSSVELKSDKLGCFKDEQYIYTLNAKLIIGNIRTDNVVPVKTNYKVGKDFSRAIKKFGKRENWNNDEKLSLSYNEKRILKDIENQKTK